MRARLLLVVLFAACANTTTATFDAKSGSPLDLVARAIATYQPPGLTALDAHFAWRDQGKGLDSDGFDRHSDGRATFHAPTTWECETSQLPLRALLPSAAGFDELHKFTWSHARAVAGGTEVTNEGAVATLLIDRQGRIKWMRFRGKGKVDVAYTTVEIGKQRLLTRVRMDGDIAPIKIREGLPPDFVDERWDYVKATDTHVVRRYQRTEMFPILLEHVVTVDFDDHKLNIPAP